LLKKILSILLVLILLFGLGIPGTAALAQDSSKPAATSRFPQLSPAAKMAPELVNAPDGQPQKALVYLNEQVNVEQVAAQAKNAATSRGTPAGEMKLVGRVALIRALQETAQRTQLGLLRFLEEKKAGGAVQSYQSFWISNLVIVSTDKATLEVIASRPEVARITPSKTVTLDDVLPTASPETANAPVLNEIGWNISMVRAPEVWSMGFTGQGVVVCNIDTGVDWTHPALSRKWLAYDPLNPTVPNPALLPYAWFDATVDQSPVPVDTNGHGTHTMGTMVCSDPQGGHQYGMAPDAAWIAADAFTTNTGTDEDLLECGQWVLAPGGDPSRAPDVVSNSWGSSEGSDTWYQATVQAWRAAGIFPSWSIGNSGPAPGSAGEPGAYPESFSSGMVDRYGVLDSQSSRGPSFWGEIKPEVVAPGVGNPSTIPGGGYSSGYAGTSMACPHSSGAAALLLNINPTLTPTDIETLLMATAAPKTSPEYPDTPNNGFGYGLLDIYSAALQLVEAGTVQGRVLLPGDDLIPPTAMHTPPLMVFEGMNVPIAVHAMDNVSVVSVELFARPTGLGEYTYVPLAMASGGIKDGIWTGTIPAYLLSADFGLQYFVRVNDYGNNMIQLPAGGETYHVTVSSGLRPGWSENFDGPTAPVGWEHFGNGGAPDCWQWGAPLAPKTSHSQPNVFATNLSGPYPNSAESWLMMPPLDLTGLTKARLAWWQWWQIENSYDHGYVAVSTDGLNFDVLRDYTGPTGSPEHPWSQEILDLTPYAGGKIFVAFILTSDSSVAKIGWVLDDFSLLGPSPIPPGPVTTLTATYNLLTGVALNWQPPADIDLEYFQVFRSTTSATAYSQTGTVPYTGTATHAFTDPNPAPGVANYYIVTSVNMGGTVSPPSNEVSVTPPGSPPVTILQENFDGAFPPTGWTVTQTSANPNYKWKNNTEWGRTLPTGWSGKCADADSDLAGNGVMDTSLVTPSFSLAGIPPYTSVQLVFKNQFRSYSSSVADTDISTDGGATWTNLLHWTGASNGYPTPNEITVPLTSYIGQANVQLRFHYYNANWAYYWMIEDLRVIGMRTLNQVPLTLEPLSSPEDLSKGKPAPALSSLTLSRPPLPQSPSPSPNALPADAYVTILESGATTRTNPATGAYSLFHVAGSYTLQASSYGYYSQTAPVTILPDQTTLQNFQLTAIPGATLEGTVTDFQSGLPIEGAELYVVEDAHILPVTSDADGHYSLTLLAPANPTDYTLRASASTYYSQDFPVQVIPGAVTTQDVPLHPFIGTPGELAYDNGNPFNAWAYYDVGNGWAVRMSPTGGAAMLQTLKFMFWGPDWPSPGGTPMQWAIYGDDGGQPGALLAGPFDGTALRTTPPSWTAIDVSSLGLVMSGDFYVAYIQSVANPNCPGMSVDDGEDSGRNWQLVGGSWSPAYVDLEGNLMIRAEVLYPVDTPVITSPLDGAVTNQPSQNIEGITAPIIEVQLFKEGALTATTLSSLSGNFSFPVTLLPGENTYHVWAVVGSRHTDPSNSVTVILHQTPPELVVDTPVENFQTNRSAVTVSGSTADPYFDHLSVNGVTVSTSPGPFSHFQLLGPTDGIYPITVTACDKAGNETTIVRQVIRDTIKPSLGSLVPATDIDIQPGDLIPVSFTSEPGLASASFLVSVPGPTTDSWIPMSETAPGHYAATWTVPEGFMANGAQVMFRAVDMAGNVGETPAPGLLNGNPSITVNLSLKQGWNLISLAITSNAPPSELFANLPAGWSLFQWDATAQRYLGKAEIVKLMPGSGYWLDVSNDAFLAVTGHPIAARCTVILSPGWNLIGNSSSGDLICDQLRIQKGIESKTLLEASAAGWVSTHLWCFSDGRYSDLWGASIPSGAGLWLKASTGCTLLFP